MARRKSLVISDSVGLTDKDDLIHKLSLMHLTHHLTGLTTFVLPRIGTTGDDIFNGEAGDDFFLGLAGNDTLLGNDGDDTLVGGKGADILDGGKDEDVVSYFDATSGVTVNLQDETKNTGDAQGDHIVDVEIIQGSIFNDRLIGSNNDDTLIGEDGNDFLNGGLGADTLVGGDGIDTVSYSDATGRVVGNLFNSSLNDGEALGDVYSTIENLEGSSFDDEFLGNDENNILSGLAGNDLLVGHKGADRLDGGEGNDTLLGGDDNDVLAGQNGDDTLSGEDGDDQLFGGSGTDDLRGGANNDMLSGGADNDTLRGDNGNDQLFGGDGVDTLEGGVDNDQLAGGLGNDTLKGEDGDDKLFGNEGDDVLVGGSGKDYLSGGVGHDVLAGGTDADIFAIRTDDNKGKAVSGADIFDDFQKGEDHIGMLDGLKFGDLTLNGFDSDGNGSLESTLISSKTGEALAVVLNVSKLDTTDFVVA